MRLSVLKSIQGAASASGSIEAYAGAIPPVGWLLCDGAIVSRSLYSTLFSLIGETYGAGDGVTTFALPDLRGEFLRGIDLGRGVDPGRGIGTFQESQLEVHQHGAGTIDALSASATHTHSGTSNAASAPHTHTYTTYFTNISTTAPGTHARARETFTSPSVNAPHAHATGTAASTGVPHSHPISGSTGAVGDTTNSYECRPLNIAMNFIIKL